MNVTASAKGHSQKTREMDHQVNGTQIHRVVETSILIQVGELQQKYIRLFAAFGLGLNAALQLSFVFRRVVQHKYKMLLKP